MGDDAVNVVEASSNGGKSSSVKRIWVFIREFLGIPTDKLWFEFANHIALPEISSDSFKIVLTSSVVFCPHPTGNELDPNVDVRRTVALGDDAVNVVEASDIKVYQETNTSVFTYYVLKSVLMTHLDLFLDWCFFTSSNNPILFSNLFDDEKTIEPHMISFGNFLVQQSKETDSYLTIVSDELSKTKKPSFAMNSIRMSLWG